jgi:cytochrome c5
MSDTAHESFIKTPRQLAVVVALSFLVPVLLIVFLTQLITGSLNIRDANYSLDAVQERIKPVAEVYIGTAPGAPPPAAAAPAAATAAGGAGKGEALFNQLCTACHTAGVNGAPKLGDKAAWAPRIKTGIDTLYTAALKGLNAMPPKGGNPSLPDADVKAAVDYMVNAAK